MTIISTFGSSHEGWTASAKDLFYDARGWIVGVQDTSGLWFFRAPDKFLGDLSAYYGGSLSFDLAQQLLVGTANSQDVVIVGGGMILVLDAGANPTTDITSYRVGLDENSGWRVGSLLGPLATRAEIETVLADVTSLSIRGGFHFSSPIDGSRIDNVVIALPDATVTSTDITSDFTYGPQGWGFVGDVATFTWKETGGTFDVVEDLTGSGGFQFRKGGFIEATDASLGPYWYWRAPPAYSGDLEHYYGGTLSFALKQSATDRQANGLPDVVLLGTNFNLVFDAGASPGLGWSYYLPGDETAARVAPTLSTASNWRIDSLNGAAATEAQIREVLSDLQGLHIRGEYQIGSDTGGLDQVVMSVFSDVQLFSDDTYTTQVAAGETLQSALGKANTGEAIDVIGNPDTNPVQVVRVNDLTIRGDAPFRVEFWLAEHAPDFTLQGTSSFSVLGSETVDRIAGNDGNNLFVTRGGNDIVFGYSGRDTLKGDAGRDELHGGAGDDSLLGGAQDDLLRGGNDLDVLHGDDGNDTLAGQRHADEMYGGQGLDRLFGGGGDDTMRGGDDNDILRGGRRKDLLYGDAGDDTLVANSHDDLLVGGADNDRLFGGSGNDTLVGGAGNDLLVGGTGVDVFLFGNSPGFDTVKDFNVHEDLIEIDANNVFDHITTGAQVVSTYGDVVDGVFVLDFGGVHAITFSSLSSDLGLAGTITVI